MQALWMLFSVFACGDVAWLNEVSQPLAQVSTDSAGTMLPLLQANDGSEVRTQADWKKRRDELRAAWLEFLGPMPARPRGGFTVLKTEELERCQRIRIRYELEPDLFVEAYLLKPKGNSAPKSLPGVVVLHETTNSTIEAVAGAAGNRNNNQLGLLLAERGFVTLCPRCFLWENTTSLNAAVATFKERHPQTLGMHKMLYDAHRAVDLLEQVPEVDPQRMGSIGHSLGAKEVLYLSAFDERIKATVASEGGITFRSTNWDAPWYLGPAIRDAKFPRNHHELLALSAPRAFLVLGGERGPGAADGDRSWPLITAALPVYKLYGSTSRLGLLNHGKGHSIPDDVLERSVDWLRTYLAKP